MERARKAEDKQARRRAILKAARAELSGRRFQELQMAQVARRAGLAKGTLYLYFETREALAMALLEELLAGWFGDLDQALDETRRPSARRVAELMYESLSRHAPLAQLLAVSQAILEHNISVKEARRWKEQLLARSLATGARLERQLALRAGAGARLLMWIHAMSIGLWGMAEPSRGVAEALGQEALWPLRVELHSEWVDAVEALVVHIQKGRRS